MHGRMSCLLWELGQATAFNPEISGQLFEATTANVHHHFWFARGAAYK